MSQFWLPILAFDPNEAENRALLGYALGLAGEYETACEHIENAIRLSPRDAFINTWYNFLGMAAVAAGRDEDAVSWAQKAVRENPQFPGGHRTLACAYGHLGRLDEAKAAVGSFEKRLPGVTITQLRESLPFPHEAQRERYLDGLRKAGLPE